MALDLENKKCVSARGSDVGAMALDLEDKACVWARGSDVAAMALDSENKAWMWAGVVTTKSPKTLKKCNFVTDRQTG